MSETQLTLITEWIKINSTTFPISSSEPSDCRMSYFGNFRLGAYSSGGMRLRHWGSWCVQSTYDNSNGVVKQTITAVWIQNKMLAFSIVLWFFLFLHYSSAATADINIHDRFDSVTGSEQITWLQKYATSLDGSAFGKSLCSTSRIIRFCEGGSHIGFWETISHLKYSCCFKCLPETHLSGSGVSYYVNNEPWIVSMKTCLFLMVDRKFNQWKTSRNVNPAVWLCWQYSFVTSVVLAVFSDNFWNFILPLDWYEHYYYLVLRIDQNIWWK